MPEKSTIDAEAPTVEETEKQVDNDLSVNDLATLKQIIDISSERGAFKANELLEVGKVYEKLTNFLNEIVKQQQAAQQKSQEE